MIKYIVLDVILTSVLTSGIVAVAVFYLLSRKYNETYKKRLDEIMRKINTQSRSFSAQVESLRGNLTDILKALEGTQKRNNYRFLFKALHKLSELPFVIIEVYILLKKPPCISTHSFVIFRNRPVSYFLD